MKTKLMRTFLMAGILVFSAQTLSAQLPKINKPKLPTASVPKVSTGSATSNPTAAASSNSAGSGKRTNHSSGLFTNCSDYYYPAQKRDTAVKYLGKLETLLAQSSISYPTLKNYVQTIGGCLSNIQQHDPECDASKFEAKYGPFEAKADEHLALYDQTEEIAQKLNNDFWLDTKAKKPELLIYRTDDYRAHKDCYCEKKKGKTYQDFMALKNEYSTAIAKLKGFTHPKAEEIIQKMATCQQNANAFAVWAAKDQFNVLVQEFNAKNKPAKPEEVIKRCDDYLVAIGRVENDATISMEPATQQAIAEAKTNTAAIKAEAERYKASPEFKAYLEKMHAEEIAQIFLPHPESQNPSLEASTMNFIKTGKWEESRLHNSKPVTTYKASTVTSAFEIEKNDLGIPKWKYHEIWVSYKAQNGKCYRAQVYVSFDYMGGGTYESTPEYTVGNVDEMAAANVMKVE